MTSFYRLGEARYSAPEVFQSLCIDDCGHFAADYSEKADIYSAALVIWYILTGRRPPSQVRHAAIRKGCSTRRGVRSRPNRNEGCESRIRHTLMSARRRGGSPGPATGESGGSARPEAGPAALAGNGGSPRAHVGRRRQHPAVGGRVCRRGARHGRAGAPVRRRRECGLCTAMKS